LGKKPKQKASLYATMKGKRGMFVQNQTLKQADATEQESRKQFRDLFDHLPDALFVHHPDGRFVDVNQAACDSLGYTREELLKLSVPDVEVGLKPEVLSAQADKVFKGEKITVQGLHKRKNGLTFPVEALISSFDYDGRKCLLAAVRDVTERKREEVAMRNLAQNIAETSTLKLNAEDKDLPSGHGEMILIVDDESSLLSSTREILEFHGYRVLTAEDGAVALAQFTQHQDEVSLVMTDLMMPKLDGVSTMHALLKIKPDVKIIAVSGLGVEANLAKSAEAGARHFLCKPYSAKALLTALHKILHK